MAAVSDVFVDITSINDAYGHLGLQTSHRVIFVG